MKRSCAVLSIYFLVCFLLLSLDLSVNAHTLPESFVYVENVIPDISLDLRYCTDHNFVGRRVDGYEQARCILTTEAAHALRSVQEELRRFGLGLKIYDAYRPQRAVDHFVRWGKDLSDTKTKRDFYPNVKKEDLFKEGYIAEKSSHSRGSTVDLNIVSMAQGALGEDLDMGTGFDFFGPESWPDSLSMSPSQRAHRLLLRVLMEKHGFESYAKEWWHFTLREEPFPNTYFDFPVQ
jgi:zinc D-Ala-D-Ala dipeptidase